MAISGTGFCGNKIDILDISKREMKRKENRLMRFLKKAARRRYDKKERGDRQKR